MDGNGAAFVTGETRSSDFPTTPGAFDRTLGRDATEDAFVAKLDPSGGALAYSTYLGGTYEDFAMGIALDGRGAATVTGRTRTADFPTTPDAFVSLRSGLAGRFLTATATYSDGNTSEFSAAVQVGVPQK